MAPWKCKYCDYTTLDGPVMPNETLGKCPKCGKPQALIRFDPEADLEPQGLELGSSDMVILIEKLADIDNSRFIDLILDFCYACNSCKSVIKKELEKRMKSEWNQVIHEFKAIYRKYDDFCNRSQEDNDKFTSFIKKLIEGE